MVLLGPTKEDQHKIHAEVNQIVNQRFFITTLAITIFAGMVAWLIPKQAPCPETAIGTFTFIASILITIVLFALFLLTHHLTRMLRLFTTYLDVTDTSQWEKDWVNYRNRFRYFGYTKAQTIIFILLGIMSTGFPFLLWAAHPYSLEPRTGAVACFVIGILYVVQVVGMGFFKWFANEGEMLRIWQKLKEE